MHLYCLIEMFKSLLSIQTSSASLDGVVSPAAGLAGLSALAVSIILGHPFIAHIVEARVLRLSGPVRVHWMDHLQSLPPSARLLPRAKGKCSHSVSFLSLRVGRGAAYGCAETTR